MSSETYLGRTFLARPAARTVERRPPLSIAAVVAGVTVLSNV